MYLYSERERGSESWGGFNGTFRRDIGACERYQADIRVQFQAAKSIRFPPPLQRGEEVQGLGLVRLRGCSFTVVPLASSTKLASKNFTVHVLIHGR